MRKSKFANVYNVNVLVKVEKKNQFIKRYRIIPKITNCDIPRLITMRFSKECYARHGLRNKKEYAAVVTVYKDGKAHMKIPGYRIKLKGFYPIVIGGVGINKRQSGFL